MSLAAVGTYEPTWGAPKGGRQIGHDEDVATLAVAAARAALEAAGTATVERVVVVTARPDVLEGAPRSAVALGAGLDVDTPVEIQVGGATATVDALLAAPPGTLVVGVDVAAPAGAGAALIADGGAELTGGGRLSHSLPMRVQRVGEPSSRVYDDPRVERERGWRRAVEQLGVDGALVVGVPARDAGKLGGAAADDVAVTGAAAPIFALAAPDGPQPRRVIAIDSGDAAALDAGDVSAVPVQRVARAPLSPDLRPAEPRYPAEIPFSMPAYDRAFMAKVGLLAGRCECGQLSYPPRSHCLACGSPETPVLEPLPRTGEVYTGVTVHVPVPGLPGPYGLVVAALDGVDVRVLLHVTDAPADRVGIGDRGRLVLRRIAVREGVDDYGYGWQPELTAEEVTS